MAVFQKLSVRRTANRYRQGRPTAQRIVQKQARLAAQLDSFHSLGQRRQHDLTLHACHSLSDTTVNAVAETDVAQRLAADVEALGVLPFSRVAVRGREEQQNLFALGDLDTGDVDGLGRRPEKRLNRSLVANDFFERAAGERQIFAPQSPLIRIARETINRAGLAQ